MEVSITARKYEYQFQSAWEALGDYLEHHGILGMKWGVRRYQPYPPGKHGTFLGQSRDNDIRIAKGSEALRVQKGKKLDKSADAVFVSFGKAEHINNLIAGTYWDTGIAMDIRYEDVKDEKKKPASVKMVVDKDLIIPSYNATMEAFIKTMSKSKLSEMYSQLNDPKIKDIPKAVTNFVENYNNVTSQEALDKAYKEFATSLMWNKGLRNKFFNELSKKGYNAIVDENDYAFGETAIDSGDIAPVIVFDAGSLKKTGAKQMNNKDWNYFHNTADLWAHDPETDQPAEFYSDKKYKQWQKWATIKVDASSIVDEKKK